jgi:hypothetical protein
MAKRSWKCPGNAAPRGVTEPDLARKVLLRRLGIQLARRLRRIDETLPDVVKTLA